MADPQPRRRQQQQRQPAASTMVKKNKIEQATFNKNLKRDELVSNKQNLLWTDLYNSNTINSRLKSTVRDSTTDLSQASR